jgi:hypothetical protein
MRRALVIAGMMLVGLLAAVPAIASAAPGDRTAAEVEREVTFTLRAEGFTVLLDTTDNDGEVSAYLAIGRGGQTASYQVPATVTADTVKAQFGSLGELDYHYVPEGKPASECNGDGKAHFDGTFAFTGENGYVHIDADSAKGVYQSYSPSGCARARLRRRVVPYQPSYSDEGATLHANAGSRRQGKGLDLSVFDAGPQVHGRLKGGIFGALWEAREGMVISRGVSMSLRAGAFSWNLAAGTATLRAPAPFTGSARFTRHGRNGHGTWTGSLAMPILGGEPVELAGPAFRAFIHKGVPQDE